jgi:hypothetical protein
MLMPLWVVSRLVLLVSRLVLPVSRPVLPLYLLLLSPPGRVLLLSLLMMI